MALQTFVNGLLSDPRFPGIVNVFGHLGSIMAATAVLFIIFYLQLHIDSWPSLNQVLVDVSVWVYIFIECVFYVWDFRFRAVINAFGRHRYLCSQRALKAGAQVSSPRQILTNKRMWKCWPIFSIDIWFLDTQNTFYHILVYCPTFPHSLRFALK